MLEEPKWLKSMFQYDDAPSPDKLFCSTFITVSSLVGQNNPY